MKKKYTLIVAIILIILSACQSDEESLLSNIGYLNLEIGTDKSTITKADEEAYNPKQIAIQIINEAGTVVKETDDYTSWTEAIALTPGKYKIAASSAGFDGKTAAWDKPYYTGLDSVTIEKEKSTSKTITCKLANVLVTVEFDEEFKKAFKSATVIVKDTTNASNKVTFKMGETSETGKAYFPVTGLFADLSVTNQKNDIHSKIDTVKEVKAQENVILRYKLAATGSTNINITLDGSIKTYTYTIGVPVTATTTIVASGANAWSSFAYLDAEIPSFVGIFDQSKLAFEYKTAVAPGWTKVEEEITVVEKDKKFSTMISGLTPDTDYQYRIVYDDGSEEGIVSDVVDFTTESKVQLPNSNFDNWYEYGDTWYAIASGDATSSDSNKMLFSFWDSGNPGTSTFNKANPTTSESNDVNSIGGKSAKLASQYVGVSFLGLGKFAAGNLYTGHFCSANTNTYQAKIYFGQPFTSRPTQLKGWFKYNRGTKIDYSTGNYKDILEQTEGDLCSVYIALVDNEGFEFEGHRYAYEINGDLSGDDPAHFKYKSAIDFSENNKNIIAYGTISDEEAKGTGEWQEFTINLKYRDLTRQPKYIIVVASASKYGDYFTGSTSSIMYVDDFELIYGDTPTTQE